jgi:hypothetical protein
MGQHYKSLKGISVMTQTMRQPAQVRQELALFRACYRLEHKGIAGAPVLSLQLLVDSQSKHVSGFCRITQAMNPPLELTTQLNGEFREISIQNLHLIIVTASGHSPVHMPPVGGVGPVIPPDLQLLMALNDDWKSGTAEYEYRINPEDPHWQIVRDAEVISTPCDAG